MIKTKIKFFFPVFPFYTSDMCQYTCYMQTINDVRRDVQTCIRQKWTCNDNVCMWILFFPPFPQLFSCESYVIKFICRPHVLNTINLLSCLNIKIDISFNCVWLPKEFSKHNLVFMTISFFMFSLSFVFLRLFQRISETSLIKHKI